MPTTRYYKQRFEVVGGFVADFTRWLVDDHDTTKGLRWELVEAYDGAFGGTQRQIPTQARGHGTFDSLPSGYSWRDKTLALGDWAVFRTVTKKGSDSFGVLEWELFVEYQSTTQVIFRLFTLNDFVTGGPDVSPPTFPATEFGVGFDCANAPADYYAVGDQGMFALVGDDGTMASPSTGFGGNMRFTYLGEVDGPSPGDTRPYVMITSDHYVRWSFDPGLNLIRRLSPLDNTTILIAGTPCYWRERANNATITDSLSHRPESRPMPTAVFFADGGHRHLAGFFRNVYLGTKNMSHRGELTGKKYIYFNNLISTTVLGSDPEVLWNAAVVFKWDGVTPVT